MGRLWKLAPLLALVTACHDRSPSPASGGRGWGERASDAPPSSDGATPPAPFTPEKVTGEARAMGTHLSYAAFTTPARDATTVRAAFDAATAEIQRVERLMTTWRPDSEVSRVNAGAGGPPLRVSRETFDLVRESVHASEMSDGAFDVTFEGLHGLWKFDEDLDPHPPTEAQIRERLPNVSYKHIRLDPQMGTIALDKPGVKIGLGGIAKGYAVDRAAEVLVHAGVDSFYVQAGGDLYTRGKKPDGTPWNAGIRDPRGGEGDYFAVLPVDDHAFSTAGDYERSYVIGKTRYHHIIDPRTGRPATASRSVTIWAPTALLADEIDDAVFILGPKKGLALVEATDGVGAVIVDAQNKVWVSKRLEGKIQMVHPPTDGI